MQEEWLTEADRWRIVSPHLDIVLTHVDDRFDTGMRAAIGADAARVLPLLAKRSFTFLIEDPATVWHLGPDRYREIARRYEELTPRRDQLAIDLNVVERYQDVYPTKQQTGVELFELIHTAATAFPRVALYFENSLQRSDRHLISASATSVSQVERAGQRLAVNSRFGVGVRWQGAAAVDGRPWPVSDGNVVWIPGGSHVLEPSAATSTFHVRRFTGDLRSARYAGEGIELFYSAASRAFAVLSKQPESLEIDGVPAELQLHGATTVSLPRGQHVVLIR
jgi:hypothetical protein